MKQRAGRISYIITRLFMLPILTIGVIAGCIGDDLDDCPVEVSLRFIYDLNPSANDLFATSVDSVNVYIYDQDDLFLKQIKKATAELTSNNLLELDVESGNYTIVTWGDNLENDYSTLCSPSLSDLQVNLLCAAGGNVNNAPRPIYHGLTKMNAKTGMASPVDVHLTRNTHDVVIKLRVPPSKSPVSVGDYGIKLTGSNGSYNYDNSLRSGQLLNYIQQYSVSSADVLESASSVLRIVLGGDLTVEFFDNTGTQIKTNLTNSRLTDIITQSPAYRTQDALDRETKFVITCELKIDNQGDIIIDVVNINDWEIIENTQPLV